jgi:hypothetical protein
MRPRIALWSRTNRRVRVALLALLGLCLIASSSALAGGFFGGNSRDPNPELAAKIVGIEQLVADYVQNVDWGPVSAAPRGVSDPNQIGELFTPHGNFAVLYWNSGHPVPLSWHPASGPSYDHCDNVGPAAVSRFFGGPGLAPRTTTAVHHVITNLQVRVEPSGRRAIVRGSMWISLGQTNSDATGGTITPIWTGRYYGKVRLTSDGWKFDYWAPIVDQPIETAGCYANNKNP